MAETQRTRPGEQGGAPTADPDSNKALVAPLATFGRHDLAIAGGKGANLGELVRAGFPVPPGFVVTTAAYERFVAAGGVAGAMQQALAGLDVSDSVALERASEAIQQAFATAPVPPELAGTIAAAYRSLGQASQPAPSSDGGAPHAAAASPVPAATAPPAVAAPAVAVRSSATAEDLPSASFAGQQETYLNVAGEDALLDAVRRCWASLWSPRAIAYRHRQGIDHRTVKLAVVVQHLVDAEAAGVLFTVNPITGARDELVIDANPGLGEAVVSGIVTPDHYVLKKGTYAAVEQQLGRREVVIRPAAGDGAAPAPAQPALADAALREIARLGETIEQHYGAPQDVEWAWAGGRPYVLQARPVTAVPPPAASEPAQTARSAERSATTPAGALGDHAARRTMPVARRRRRAQRRRDPNLAGELFPFRPYPLDVAAHLQPMLRAVGNAMAAPLGLRFPTVEDCLEIEDGVPVRLKVFRPRPTWRVVYKPWLTLWQRRKFDLLRWQDDPALAAVQRRAQTLAGRDLTALTWPGVVAALHEAIDLGPAVGVLRDRYFPLAIWATIRLWLLLRLAGQQHQFGALLSGVATKTMALNRELERLAERVRAEPALRDLFATAAAADLPAALATMAARPEGQAFWSAFEEFQRVYGNRETAITIFSQPSWGEAPEIPLGVIKALAAGQSDAGAAHARPGSEAPAGAAGERPAGAPAAWEQARDAVLAHSVLGKGPLRRAFLHLLERAREFPRLREDTHFYFGLPLPLERRAVFDLARRLVGTGALAARGDVFYLTLDELERAGQPWPPSPPTIARLRQTVERRKARWEVLAGQPFVDPSLTEPPEGTASAPDALLAGTPGSAGMAEGPVCVVRSPAEFAKLQAGDVLVAPFTNPSWTPLFPLAAAVVVDTGGAISHAAIVAREYGVPAVMGTRFATTRLCDGQRVRVDGTRGLVFVA